MNGRDAPVAGFNTRKPLQFLFFFSIGQQLILCERAVGMIDIDDAMPQSQGFKSSPAIVLGLKFLLGEVFTFEWPVGSLCDSYQKFRLCFVGIFLPFR